LAQKPLDQKNNRMNKIYYLSSCSTCARIMKELGISAEKFTLQDIKTEIITASQLDELKKMAGSYEALFSRVALKYRAMGLDKEILTESDYRKYILSEYTFLKRPVIVCGKQLFIGNSKKTVAAAKAALSI
jgi:arsenate reductase